MVTVDGVEQQIRYSCGVRIRGAGSRGAAVKNYRVNIPSDRPWNGKTAINLNTQYPHIQMVGSVIAQKSGLPAANARVTQVRVNGENLARSGPPISGNGSSWGSYVLVEPINNEWAGRIFPTDSGGNVYRASSGGHAADLSYQGTSIQTYVNRGYSKTSNGSDNDWTDLFNLVDVLNNTPNPGYSNAVNIRLNVREWMSYFAVLSLMEYSETSLGSGFGDDYAMYRGLVDTRFKLVSHDFDTIFSQGDTAGNINESIFIAANIPTIDRFLKWPDFAPLYYEELYRLANTVFTPEQVNSVFDQYLTTLVTEPTLTAMKNFNANRRLGVLNQIPQIIRITNSLPVVNGYPTATNPAVSLTGAANAIRTRSVRVNGLLATWTPWRGAWTITGVPLNPGVNRVLVQSFDGLGAEVERATVDIVYDDGSVADIAGNISADTTWTAAGGPYRLNNSITVAVGAKLTIQPGTTIYLGSSASLNVQGQLVAEGTDTQRIVFTREPSSTARWGGINVTGATAPETRIAYAHFEFNGGTAIHSSDGTLFLDHLTFGSTDHQYVSLDRSSFVVQNCVFPTITGSFEPVHGTGGIKAGGRGIVTRNFWGKVSGYNDAFDFTGGNRPGPILQVIDNVFMGSDDDLLDLDSTDAWVEGNIFLHTHRNGSPDSSSAVSGGADNADTSQVTVIGNIFYDVDQAANAKQGNFYTLINNTIVHQTRIGSDDTNTAVVILADDNTVQGLGMYLEGNIIEDALNLTRNVTTAIVTYTNNIIHQLAGTAWDGPGGNNSSVDPLLKRIPQLSETTNFTTWAQAQVMRDWFGLQPGSPAIGAGPNGRDLGGVIPLGASISGEPIGTTFQTSATLTVGVNRTGSGIPTAGFPNGSGFTQYRWRLDGGSWSTETPIATPIALNGLANGPHYVEVTGKRDSDFYQDDPAFGFDTVITRSRTWTVDTSFAAIRINEILARNDSAVAHEGAFPDIVEIFNAGSSTVDLSGWGLTDDATSHFKFTFPSGTTLGSGKYLLLYGDDRITASGLHLGFGLDQEGDALYLYNAASALVDSVEFGIQLPDLSIGRGADGQWTLCTPTFGDANARHALGDPHALKINEWLANGQTLYPDDFIEIYNPTPAPVLLGGLYLTDEPLGWPTRHQVVPLTFMSASAHFVFIADSHTKDGPDHVDFKLSSTQGAIGLFDSGINLIDSIFYGSQRADISEGRSPSGSSAIAKFNVPTPGGPNPGPSGSSTTISNLTVNIFGVSDKQWRYDGTGTDRGTTWRAANYNDSAWALGFGMFGFETTPAIYPYPFLSNIPSPDQGGPNTAYYRTHFQWTNGLGFSLVATSYVDDGAVFYLNGQEAGRLRITANPVLFNSAAQNASEPAIDVVTLPTTNLFTGDNVIAVEVHQPGGGSSDDVFGLSLSAVKSFTNTIVFGLVLNEVMARNQSFTNAGGTNLADWFELHNPSANAFDLSGMSVSDQIDNPRRWVFPSGTTLAAGGYLVVRCDPDLPPTTNAGPVLNTGFGLDGEGGDAVYVFDTVARGGAILDSVLFGIQVPDLSIGRSPNVIGPWALTLPTPGLPNIAVGLGNAANLKVNEWLANPSGNDDDFLELYNPNAQPVDLSGLYLSDSLTNRTASRIQALSFIGTGNDAFVRFLADGQTDRGADHVNFNLRAAGESVALFSAREILIDAYTFTAQEPGVSEGRFPNGSSNIARFRGTATPGRSNLVPLDSVAVNEVLTHTDVPFEDAIELQNLTVNAIDLSGWYLTDSENDPKRFRIPNGTILEPYGSVVFYEYQFNPDFSGRPPNFALNSTSGDEVFLFPADQNGDVMGFRTGVKFNAAANAVSFGRYLTSVGPDFTALSERTFGVDNPATVEQFRSGTGRTNAYPLVGPVVIHEIMYHPPDVVFGGVTNDNDMDEFIELRNISATPVPLFHPDFPTNTWRLRDAADFEFPEGVTLPAGGYLLLVGFDPSTNAIITDAFKNKYGVVPGTPIFGPWRGKLANGDENVELYKPDAPESQGSPDAGFVPYIQVDKVHYADSAPWPSLADGNPNGVGMSLQRRVAANYGNDPVNWIAGVPTPGGATGPGGVTPPTITAFTPAHLVTPGANDTMTVTATGTAPLSYQWRFNGNLIQGVTSSSLIVPGFQATNAGIYSVIVINAAGAASASTRADLQSLPVIIRQPQNQVGAFGGSVVFSVLARGTPPLTYQWRKGSTDIPGATHPTLVLTNLQTSDISTYSVVVGNAFGSVTSAGATLSLLTPPTVVTQPQSTNVFVGGQFTLSVAAIGSTPFRYQWTFNGLNISGATNSTYTRLNAQATNSGVYRVVVSNGVGFALSDPAVVEVTVPPQVTITASDGSASEPSGNPGEFTVTRTGSLLSPLVVSFSVGGNAAPGFDYVELSSPVTIPAGSFTATIPVVVIDDSALEGNETVSVTLLPTVNYTVASPSNAVVTILDNDNLAPTAILTAPAGGLLGTFPTNVVLSALASDPDGSVIRVEFFDNGTNRIGQSTTLPYGIVWTNGLPGVHVLTAVATDNLGSTGVSAPVTVEINAPPSVAVTSPSDGAIISIGANVTVAANAFDIDGTVTRVDFYLGTNLLGSDSSSPYSVSWLNAPEGSYALTARAFDDRGGVSVSTPVNVVVGTPVPAFGDNFANRGLVTGFTNTVRGTNTTFTREPGEPKHDNRNGNHSGWMSWTAPASGPCVMDTLGSSFDTVLAVYTGTVVSNLVKVVSNDDADIDTVQSRVAFSAVVGTTYQIAVDGYATNAYGIIVFHLSIPNPYPIVTSQPLSQIATQGNNVSFSVGVGGPSPFTYQWRFNNNNLNGQTSATLNRNNVQAGNQGNYTVVIANASGSVTSSPAALIVRTPPIIQTQPANLGVLPGDNVVFFVRATGWEPLTYQWSFNGVSIPGATASNLVMNGVQGRNEGLYSVRISNVLGTTNSQNATLSVNDGLITATLEPLLTFTNEWRYHALGGDLGTAWRFPGYDDSGWSNGAALFGFETTPLIYAEPFRSVFGANDSNNVPISTYYFRTLFAPTNTLQYSGLFVTYYADDGAVWYLNGREAARIRLSNVIPVDGMTNRAVSTNLNNEGVLSSIILPVTNLTSGQNLIAVELHQGQLPSSDAVFGMTMDAFTIITNRPNLYLAGLHADGSAPLALTGISGRNYAIDVSTNLINWSTLTTFTNFIGIEEFLDVPPPGSDRRFYRGRLAP